MNENHPHRARIEELLAQDTVVSSFQFKEFRMNLEESIKRLEQQARKIHRAALVSLGIFIACVAFGPLVIRVMDDWILSHRWILWIWSGVGLVALFTTGVLAAIDHYKYRPALKRKQRDLVWTAIDQLQLEVADLKRKLE